MPHGLSAGQCSECRPVNETEPDALGTRARASRVGELDDDQAAALERAVSWEGATTEARPIAGRLRFASLPMPASLEDVDFDAASGVDPQLVAELGTCCYLEAPATNVWLIGPPGVGNTHLSVGLASAAAHAGYRTYVTTAANVAARCRRRALKGRWAMTMRFFEGPALVVIDLCRGRDYAEVDHRAVRIVR